jgi:hypothetical protein
VNLRAAVWGVAFVGVGLLLATASIKGTAELEAGPRVGMGVALVVLGLVVFAIGNVGWLLRRTAKAGDYAPSCPVGATCACGHFNFKPRRACRQCGAATSYV